MPQCRIFALAELLKYKHILAIYQPHLWMQPSGLPQEAGGTRGCEFQQGILQKPARDVKAPGPEEEEAVTTPG